MVVLAIYVTVGLSALAHGLTAAPLADRYARWYKRHTCEKAPMESAPAEVTRSRGPRGLPAQSGNGEAASTPGGIELSYVVRSTHRRHANPAALFKDGFSRRPPRPTRGVAWALTSPAHVPSRLRIA